MTVNLIPQLAIQADTTFGDLGKLMRDKHADFNLVFDFGINRSGTVRMLGTLVTESYHLEPFTRVVTSQRAAFTYSHHDNTGMLDRTDPTLSQLIAENATRMPEWTAAAWDVLNVQRAGLISLQPKLAALHQVRLERHAASGDPQRSYHAPRPESAWRDLAVTAYLDALRLPATTRFTLIPVMVSRALRGVPIVGSGRTQTVTAA